MWEIFSGKEIISKYQNLRFHAQDAYLTFFTTDKLYMLMCVLNYTNMQRHIMQFNLKKNCLHYDSNDVYQRKK